MKIRPVGVKFLQVDGQTDMTNTIVVFRNSGNVPKTCYDYELVGCDNWYFRR
jgi:hypothetical protein